MSTNSKPIRFGILLDHQYRKSNGVDLTDEIAQMIDFVHAVRDLGFDSIFGIHHYLSSLRTLQPINLMARLIDHTGSMQIGTGILILPFVHPVHHAEELATLDQMSGGRLTLGVGSGYRENEFEAFGIERKQRTGRMRESLELITALWEGGKVDYDGRYYSLHDEECSVVPLQKPHPPIWIGANSPGGIKRVAEWGYAWLAPANVKRNWARGNLEMFREVLAESGNGDRVNEFPIHRDLCIADSKEEAIRLAAPYAKASYAEYSDYGLDYFNEKFDEFVEKSFFYGTPEEISTKMDDYIDAGFDHFVFRVQWLDSPKDLSIQILERFAAEIMPRYQ